MIGELVVFVTEQLKKSSSEADAALYIFLVRCLHVLDFRNRKPDTKILAKKVFELEQRIGNADYSTISRFVYDIFLVSREIFYVFYANDAIKYQKYV